MSFGFGFNQPATTSGTTSLLFGPSVTAPSVTNQTAATTTAFSFGLPANQASVTPNSTAAAGLLRPPFSMSTAASAASTTSSATPFASASGQVGFSFGTSAFPSVTTLGSAPSSTTNTGQLNSSFSFGTPTTTTTGFPTSTAPTSGFAFGMPTTTSTAFPASTAPTSGFAFGTPTTTSTGFPTSTAPTSSSGMFNFGLFSPATAATTTTTTPSTGSLSAFSLGTTASKPPNSVIANPLLSTRSGTTEGVAVSSTPSFNIAVTNTGTSGATLGGFSSALSQPSNNSALSFGKPLSLPQVTGAQPQGLSSASTLSFGDTKSTSVSALQSTTLGSQSNNNLLLNKPLPSVASATTIATPASVNLSTSLTSTSVGMVPSVGSAVTATTTATTTTANIPLSKSSTMTYHQLEDAVNKWAHDLEEQERFFMDEADRITEWDSTLLKNAEKISTLYEKVNECKTDQSRLEQELDFIDGQQRELEQLLESLERTSSELPPGQLHSDFEREAIFQLATNVDLEIGQLLSDMREMAAQINATNSTVFTATATDEDDKSRKVHASGDQLSALQQVTRILNCHMHSLNWIHQNTQELMDRVKILDTP